MQATIMDYFTILCLAEMLQKMHNSFGALMIFFGLKVGLQGFQEFQVLRLIVSVAHASIKNAFKHTSNVERGLIRFLNPKSAPNFSKSTSTIPLPKNRGPPDKRKQVFSVLPARFIVGSFLFTAFCYQLARWHDGTNSISISKSAFPHFLKFRARSQRVSTPPRAEPHPRAKIWSKNTLFSEGFDRKTTFLEGETYFRRQNSGIATVTPFWRAFPPEGAIFLHRHIVEIHLPQPLIVDCSREVESPFILAPSSKKR